MPDPSRVPRPGRRSILAASLVSPFLASSVLAARKVPPTALVVPLSGVHAAIGRSMARAAALAQGRDAKGLLVLDSGADADAAATATRAAIKQGAGLVLGPLLTSEVRAVLAAAAGRAPVVTFSNDRTLRESGAFLMGITADQSVGAVLRYARGRGVRRVRVAVGTDGWGQQVLAAAHDAAQREGIELTTRPAEADATLVTGVATMPGLTSPGQLLCAPSSELDADALRRLEGAWLASPDPTAFQSFAAAYEAANGSPPGLIAMLAYDAAAMAAKLRGGGVTDRPALLSSAGFEGVCGAFRFRDDGSAARSLAILAVEHGGYRVIAPTAQNATSG